MGGGETRRHFASGQKKAPLLGHLVSEQAGRGTAPSGLKGSLKSAVEFARRRNRSESDRPVG